MGISPRALSYYLAKYPSIDPNKGLDASSPASLMAAEWHYDVPESWVGGAGIRPTVSLSLQVM